MVVNIESIINEYTAYVYKIVENIVGDSLVYQDKEEIVADTFYLLWKNQEKISTNLKSYLSAIARNCAYEKLRKEKNTQEYIDTLYGLEELEENRMLIELRLEKLNEEELKLFELYYTYGYKIREIAKFLKIQTNTVKIRLFRLRKKLREDLK